MKKFSTYNSCFIPQPGIIREYNKHLGGVDLLDTNMGLSVIKVWFLYKRAYQEKGAYTVLKKADSLSKIVTAGPSTRGRPSNLEEEIQNK